MSGSSEPSTVSAPPAAASPPQGLNFAYHVIIGVAMGVIAPFTGLAWVPAILTGMVIGRAEVERRQGVRASRATQVVRVLAVTGGVLAMLVLGVVIGGLIAFLIAALATFSERVAQNTTTTDQVIARILISIIALVVWFVVIYVLKLNLSLNFGGGST